MKQFKEHFERINNDYYYSGKYYGYDGGEDTYRRVFRFFVAADILIVLFLILSGLTFAGTLTSLWYVVLLYAIEVVGGYAVIRDGIRVVRDGTELKEPTVFKILPMMKVYAAIYGAAAALSLITSVIHIFLTEIYLFAILYILIKLLSLILGCFCFIFLGRISVNAG